MLIIGTDIRTDDGSRTDFENFLEPDSFAVAARPVGPMNITTSQALADH